MKRSILLILVIFFFLTTFLCLSANSISDVITFEDFLVMWQRAQDNIERNNPGGHSEVYTDTEMLPEGIELRIGWIEGIGIWGIGFNWFEQGVIPAIGNGYYDKNGIYVPTDIISPETNPGDDYTYYQITLPPDFRNIPPGATFPSIGFYTHN